MALKTITGVPNGVLAPVAATGAELVADATLSPPAAIAPDDLPAPDDAPQVPDDFERYLAMTAAEGPPGPAGIFASAPVQPASENVQRLAQLVKELPSWNKAVFKVSAHEIACLLNVLSSGELLPSACILASVFRNTPMNRAMRFATACICKIASRLTPRESMAFINFIAADHHFRLVVHLREILPVLFTRLAPPERGFVAARAEGWLRSPEDEVRDMGYDVVRTLIKHFPHEIDWSPRIGELLADPDAHVVELAVKLAVHLHKDAGRADDLLALTLTFEAQLGDPDEHDRIKAVKALGDLFASLQPAHRPDRLRHIEGMFEDRSEWVTLAAIDVFQRFAITEALDHEGALSVVEKLAALLDKEGHAFLDIRGAAAQAMIHLIPLLELERRPHYVRLLIERASDIGGISRIIEPFEPKDQHDAILRLEGQMTRHAWGRGFVELVECLPLLKEQDLLGHVYKLYEFQRTSAQRLQFSGEQHAHIWNTIISRLNPQQRISFAAMIADRREGGSRILEMIVSSLKHHERLTLLASVLASKGGDLAQVSTTFLDILSRRLPPDVLTSAAEKRGDVGLRAIARYHARHLPFDDYFWPQYLASRRRPIFLSKVSQEVAAHRRSEVAVFTSERDLHLAYAALDAPEGLPFERFASEMKGPPQLPRPFVDRPFVAKVREIRSTHLAIDKGKVRQALAPMEAVQGVREFQRYLEALIKKENGSLKHIRNDLTSVFPNGLDALHIDTLLASAQKLLALIWPKRGTPPVQNLIVHLAFLIAWHKEGNEVLAEKMAAASGEKVPSDTLFDALKASEEFYRDAIEDVIAAAVKGSGKEIPPLRKRRELLGAELGRARGEGGEEVDVEFIPSKQPADRFFGYVGEDCTKFSDKAIERPDFQVYRMIAAGRLVGMLYLQEAVLDGKRLLVMAVQPRSSWAVDQSHLLGVIEREFSKIGEAQGYDAVALMADDNQRSNRLDMLKAIEARKYEKIAFKQGVSGAVFEGNEFLALWKR